MQTGAQNIGEVSLAEGAQPAGISRDSAEHAPRNYPPSRQGAEVLMLQFLFVVGPEESFHSPEPTCSGKVGPGGQRKPRAKKCKCWQLKVGQDCLREGTWERHGQCLPQKCPGYASVTAHVFLDCNHPFPSHLTGSFGQSPIFHNTGFVSTR